MQIHGLNSTALPVTRIGLGLAALGRPGYINLGHARDLEQDYDAAAMEARTHAVLDAAYAGGVRYFDAARSYGKAEDFLGSWIRLRGHTPGQITVGSKWGYTYTAGWQVQADAHEIKDHSLPVLVRQWQESRARLGRSLGLYQIHSATLQSGVLSNADVLAELARLKREESVSIGLTVSGRDQAQTIRQALQVERDGKMLFDTIQVTWNLLERSTGEVLQQAKQLGLGVIVKEALANGRLAGRVLPGFESQAALLQQEAQRLHTTVDALALAAVLAQPWVDVVLSGAANTAQLRANLAALEVPWDEQTAARLSVLEEPPAHYWQTRSGLAWN